jgi:sec-independent protein translocase protein TatA
MFGLGPLEIILIIFLLLFFTGGKKLQKIGEGIGRGIGEFKRALRGSSPPSDQANAEGKKE